MTLSLANIPFLNKRIKFPVTPHIPGGLTTPGQLRQIAAAVEKYGGTLKIVGSSITLLGINAADGDSIIEELGVKPESFITKSVRAVTICPGKPHCPMAQQDSAGLGLDLDNEFYGLELPGKLRIAISACPNCCAEPMVKDIGLYGTAKGYILAVGGNSGRQAKVAAIVAENVPADKVKKIIQSILAFYSRYGQTKERLGQTIDRIGWNEFISCTIPPEYNKKIR